MCYTWTSSNAFIWLVCYLGILGISYDWDLKLRILFSSWEGRLLTIITTNTTLTKTYKSRQKVLSCLFLESWSVVWTKTIIPSGGYSHYSPQTIAEPWPVERTRMRSCVCQLMAGITKSFINWLIGWLLDQSTTSVTRNPPHETKINITISVNI